MERDGRIGRSLVFFHSGVSSSNPAHTGLNITGYKSGSYTFVCDYVCNPFSSKTVKPKIMKF